MEFPEAVYMDRHIALGAAVSRPVILRAFVLCAHFAPPAVPHIVFLYAVPTLSNLTSVTGFLSIFSFFDCGADTDISIGRVREFLP